MLFTCDKDFGELAFRRGASVRSGVVLFRCTLSKPQHLARTALAVLSTERNFEGHFTIVEDNRLRMMPLPLPSPRVTDA